MSASPALRAAARALQAVPGLAGARVLEPLGAGPTNACFLVEHQGERLVLRLDRPQAAALGLDRESERRVCEAVAVAAAGMTPAYRYFDVATGICLRPYLEGECLKAADLLDARVLEELAGRLRQLHALEPVGGRFYPLAATRRYARDLGTNEAASLARRAGEILAALPATAATLCHNDLVAENILRVPRRGLVLIDWEYAGIGDPYFDLAVVVRHHDLGEVTARQFLSAYLNREPDDAERLRLKTQCEFYGCLLALWNERVSPFSGA